MIGGRSFWIGIGEFFVDSPVATLLYAAPFYYITVRFPGEKLERVFRRLNK